MFSLRFWNRQLRDPDHTIIPHTAGMRTWKNSRHVLPQYSKVPEMTSSKTALCTLLISRQKRIILPPKPSLWRTSRRRLKPTRWKRNLQIMKISPSSLLRWRTWRGWQPWGCVAAYLRRPFLTRRLADPGLVLPREGHIPSLWGNFVAHVSIYGVSKKRQLYGLKYYRGLLIQAF